MIVVWNFTETSDGVVVQISHELDLRWPLIGGLVSKYLVGRFFIHHIRHLDPRGAQAESRRLGGMSRRVVVTGVGALTCIGHGAKGIWNGILRREIGHSDLTTRFDPTPFETRNARLRSTTSIPRNTFRRTSSSASIAMAQFALVLTRQALR